MQQAKLRGPDQVDSFLRSLSAADKERFKGNDFIKLHPFRAKNLARSAALYSGIELINAIKLFTETNRKLVLSPVSRRLLLEQLSFAIIKGSRATLQG